MIRVKKPTKAKSEKDAAFGLSLLCGTKVGYFPKAMSIDDSNNCSNNSDTAIDSMSETSATTTNTNNSSAHNHNKNNADNDHVTPIMRPLKKRHVEAPIAHVDVYYSGETNVVQNNNVGDIVDTTSSRSLLHHNHSFRNSGACQSAPSESTIASVQAQTQAQDQDQYRQLHPTATLSDAPSSSSVVSGLQYLNYAPSSSLQPQHFQNEVNANLAAGGMELPCSSSSNNNNLNANMITHHRNYQQQQQLNFDLQLRQRIIQQQLNNLLDQRRDLIALRTHNNAVALSNANNAPDHNNRHISLTHPTHHHLNGINIHPVCTNSLATLSMANNNDALNRLHQPRILQQQQDPLHQSTISQLLPFDYAVAAEQERLMLQAAQLSQVALTSNTADNGVHFQYHTRRFDEAT